MIERQWEWNGIRGDAPWCCDGDEQVFATDDILNALEAQLAQAREALTSIAANIKTDRGGHEYVNASCAYEMAHIARAVLASLPP